MDFDMESYSQSFQVRFEVGIFPSDVKPFINFFPCVRFPPFMPYAFYLYSQDSSLDGQSHVSSLLVPSRVYSNTFNFLCALGRAYLCLGSIFPTHNISTSSPWYRQRSLQSSIMSGFISNWDFDSLRAADQDMFDDGESELSDGISLDSSMDIDMDPFESGAPSHAESSGFSVQYLLPLEVTCRS